MICSIKLLGGGTVFAAQLKDLSNFWSRFKVFYNLFEGGGRVVDKLAPMNDLARIGWPPTKRYTLLNINGERRFFLSFLVFKWSSAVPLGL